MSCCVEWCWIRVRRKWRIDTRRDFLRHANSRALRRTGDPVAHLESTRMIGSHASTTPRDACTSPTEPPQGCQTRIRRLTWIESRLCAADTRSSRFSCSLAAKVTMPGSKLGSKVAPRHRTHNAPQHRRNPTTFRASAP